ncbi:MAG: hypothetical protein ACE363_10615 [Alphaproteobacteria bacterium]
MDDNLVLVLTTLPKYLLITAMIGALLGFELARSNGFGRFKSTLRGGSIGALLGGVVVASVTTVMGYI